jgi:type IV secretory pathway VirB10-like protein
VREQALKAPDKESEVRERSVTIGREEVKEQADTYLREHYRNADGEMTCQICKGPLPFKLDDGREYFEVVEFLPELRKRHPQNYLALCPNHSAMYRFVNGSKETTRDEFQAIDGNELPVVLAEKDVTVYFSKTHIVDLKAVLEAEESLPPAPEDAAAAPAQVASAAPAAGLTGFDPQAAGPASTAAQPADPTAVQNRQDQKEAFQKAGTTETRNSGNLQMPASPYQVMAGTVISAALVTGIKSDLPGDVIGTVTAPVYDTATGRYLLIPQGSRVLGKYNSQVAYGQSRVQIVWNRIILPDASSLTLDNLAGADPAGYAGLEDGVDWHWGRILAGAALSTVLGVGSELAVSNQGNVNGNTVIALRDSAQDTANQVGQEFTRRNLNIQPTLTERPGLPVSIIVNRDLVLRPYQPMFFNRGTSQ